MRATLLLLLCFVAHPWLTVAALAHAQGVQANANQPGQSSLPLTIAAKAEGTTSLTFSPDGRTLAAADQDGKIGFWDPRTGKPAKIVLIHPVHLGVACDTKIAFSRDGTLLASIRPGPKSEMRLWNWKKGQEVARLEGMMHASSLSFAPDGKSLAIVDAHHIYVFDPEKKMTTEKLRHKDGGHFSWLAFSADSKMLAVSGSCFQRLRLWDVSLAAEAQVIKANGQIGCFMAVHWLSGGKSLLVVGMGNTVSLWDVKTATQSLRFGDVPGLDPSHALAVSPDQKYAALGTSKKKLHLWELATSKHAVFSDRWLPAFSPDGKLIATLAQVRGSTKIVLSDFASLTKAAK